ncbi:MAG: hypothetical protein ABW022_06455 [Actinoplanes sp.]
MSFGDFDPDDAYDREPADPEQVARKLHALRHSEALEGASWEELTPAQQTLLVLIVARLLAWLRRQGAA